jgi:hypothetical protein
VIRFLQFLINKADQNQTTHKALRQRQSKRQLNEIKLFENHPRVTQLKHCAVHSSAENEAFVAPVRFWKLSATCLPVQTNKMMDARTNRELLWKRDETFRTAAREILY